MGWIRIRITSFADIPDFSMMEEYVTLLSAEEEFVIATHHVQEMPYVKKVLKSLELQVELLMNLYLDNKGAKELMDNGVLAGTLDMLIFAFSSYVS